jgi:DNA repair protein RecO
MTKHVKLSGIVLNKTIFFEKDCLVEIFTPTDGKKKIIAKYALSKSFKFGGLIEPLNTIECELYSGRSFLLLNQCRLVNSFTYIKGEFNRLVLALHYLAIIRHATPFDMPNIDLYHFLIKQLDLLNHAKDPKVLLNQFYSQFLIHEGLLNPNIVIDNKDFYQRYYDYTNTQLKPPLFIEA